MYFIPEIGEEVLVGFEGGNAEKPYVLGAMYNGSESSGFATPNNDFKVTQTRTGIKIVMNDASKSLLAEDPSGNSVLLDGKGNINITAPNTVNINATDINITASKNITTSAGMNISESAGVNKSTNVGMLHNMFVGGNSLMNVKGSHDEIIMGDKKTHTEKDMTISNKDGLTYNTEGEIAKHSKKSIGVNSAEKSKLF
jgi:type VI secretion system secreted protein VgrG